MIVTKHANIVCQAPCKGLCMPHIIGSSQQACENVDVLPLFRNLKLKKKSYLPEVTQLGNDGGRIHNQGISENPGVERWVSISTLKAPFVKHSSCYISL